MRAYRESASLSQADLGKLLEKSQGAIAKYETNLTEMDYATLIRFCDLANISIDYFLGRVDHPHSEVVSEDAFVYAKDTNSPALTPEEIIQLKSFLRSMGDNRR